MKKDRQSWKAVMEERGAGKREGAGTADMGKVVVGYEMAACSLFLLLGKLCRFFFFLHGHRTDHGSKFSM